MATVTISRRCSEPAGPVLSWPGRERSDLVIEAREPPVSEHWGEGEPLGRVVAGDNLEVMAALDPGSVRLAYLDPPFFSGQRYAYRTRAGDGWLKIPSFEDRWGSDLGSYLSFMDERLLALARALSEDGSVYVHLDASACHYVKVLLDEILGEGAFCRQIVWKIGWVSGFKSKVRNWVRNHDVILYYARPGALFNRKLLPHPEGYVRRAGEPGKGRPIDDVWLDIPSIQLMSFSGEKTGWATQKNEALLERIIEASSEPGDLVLDPFCGAGTTAVAASRLGRRFLTIDESPLAVHLTRRRLLERHAAARAAREASRPSGRAPGFTVESDPPPKAGPVLAEARPSLLGPELRLLEVPEARGAEGADWSSNVDGWWIARATVPERPLWHVHRVQSRRPAPVALECPPLPGVRGGEELLVTAVDLAGGRHEGRVVY